MYLAGLGGDEGRDDGVVRPLVRRDDVGVAALQAKVGAAVLQRKAAATGHDRRAKAHIVGVDEAARVAVAVHYTKIDRVARRDRRPVVHVGRRVRRVDQARSRVQVVLQKAQWETSNGPDSDGLADGEQPRGAGAFCVCTRVRAQTTTTYVVKQLGDWDADLGGVGHKVPRVCKREPQRLDQEVHVVGRVVRRGRKRRAKLEQLERNQRCDSLWKRTTARDAGGRASEDAK